MAKKPAAQLQREIDVTLAKRAAKQRQKEARLVRAQEASEAGTSWRRQIIDQIQRWVEANNQGLWDERYYNLVIKRLTKLVSFIRSFFPDAPEAPIETDLAAALIVLPLREALPLARRLFGAGPGIAHDLQAEDLTFNTDWFHPEEFHWTGARRLQPLASKL